MLSKVDISLDVKNNVNYPVQISVLGSTYNPRDTSNSNIEYRWDVTGFTFTDENSVLVQYKLNGASQYQIFDGSLPNQTLEAVVEILNLLGIGFFSLYTESGSTYIGTYNDNYNFGQLNIYASTNLSNINPNFLIGTGAQTPNGSPANVNFNFVDSSGNIYVSGPNGTAPSNGFYQYNGYVFTGQLIKILPDGTLDTTFVCDVENTLSTSATITAMAEQSDGKFIIGGYFNSIGGNTAIQIARINADGSFDSTFVTGTGITSGTGARINTIAIDETNGRVLVGGDFEAYNSIALNGGVSGKGNIVAIDITNGNYLNFFPKGTIPITDPNFGTAYGFQGVVNKIIVRNNEYYIASSDFYIIDNSPASSSFWGTFVIFYANGNGQDTSINSYQVGFSLISVPGGILDFGFLSNGDIVFYGTIFRSFNGYTITTNINGYNLQKVSSTGVFDTAFATNVGLAIMSATNTPLAGVINGLSIQNDDKIVITGSFAKFNTVSSNKIARINTDGTYDSTFIVGTGFIGPGTITNTYNNGLITATGLFVQYNSVPYNSIIQFVQ